MSSAQLYLKLTLMTLEDGQRPRNCVSSDVTLPTQSTNKLLLPKYPRCKGIVIRTQMKRRRKVKHVDSVQNAVIKQ